MVRIQRILSILLVLLVGVKVSHAQDGGEANKALDKKRGELREVMSAWSEHRSQKIVVLNIQGLSDAEASGDELERLESRLKTLLNKTRSNREWKSYWAEEARLSGKVLALYNGLSPLQGTGVLSSESERLVKEAAAAELKAQAKQEAFKQASVAKKAVRQKVQEAFNALDETLRGLPEKVKALEGEVETLTAQVADCI